jgi:streptogramin lyase/predicted Ser/Thr protein kinase
MDASGDLRQGTELLGYQIDELVGRGGMGVVYRAYDLRLKRNVALKLLAPQFAEDKSFRARFLKESEAAASLDHPNVVPVYEAGEAAGFLYIAMRYVDGSDLNRLLTDEPLERVRALEVVSEVGKALDAAHARDLVHRDVKASNVLIDRDGHVYLSDFGLSRLLADAGGSLGLGSSLGTPDYAAPEQIRGGRVDGRTDIYALGCLLFECLTGRPPFAGSDAEVLFAHLEEEPPTLPGLESVLPRALAKDPTKRYASAREFCDEARAALGLSTGPRFSRKQLLVAGSGAALALAAAVGVPLALTRSRGGGPAVALPLREHSLVRVDATTARMMGATAVGVEPGPVAVGAEGVWVASPEDAKLVRLDALTGKVVDRVDVARVGRPSVLAAGEGSVWLGDPGNKSANVVYRYEPSSRRLTKISTGEIFITPDDLVVAGGAVWMGCDVVLRIDPHTGRIRARVRLPGATLAAGEGALWAAGETTTRTGQQQSLLWQFDLRTARVLAKSKLEPGVTDLAAGAGAIWVVRLEDDSITRVDVKTRAIREGFRVRQPEIVTASGGSVWATSARDATLTRYDTRSGDLATIDVGGRPTGLAVDNNQVWVAVSAV